MQHIFEGKEVKTYGDMGNIVSEITKAGDRTRAQAFLASYRAFCKDYNGQPENADANIGYWHGYDCGHNKASGRDPQWLPTTPLVLAEVHGRTPMDDRRKVSSAIEADKEAKS